MTGAILEIIKLVVLIFGEFFAAKKRAREANEKYEADKKAMLELFEKALVKMRIQAGIDSESAANMDDVVDRELRNDPVSGNNTLQRNK